MRLTARTIANGAAWGVFALVIAAAVVLADMLGFLGLFLVGGIGWLVCLRASLSQDTPTWSHRSLETQMAPDGSPERRAARRAEREGDLAPLRFFGRCGMALAAVGAAGFLWQYWLGPLPNGH